MPKKNPSEKHQRGFLCFRGSGRRCLCFGRGSGNSSMFWMSVVHRLTCESHGPTNYRWGVMGD